MPVAFFHALSSIVSFLDSIQKLLGRSLRWLVVAMTFTVVGIVIARLFDWGSTAVQESVTYMHGTLFMLCMAYTAYRGGHVRVDISYRRFTLEQKAWVDLLGNIFFLLPFALFMAFISFETASVSWRLREASTNPGGLAFLYLLKALPVVAGTLLALHAFSDSCRQLLTISLKHQ